MHPFLILLLAFLLTQLALIWIRFERLSAYLKNSATEVLTQRRLPKFSRASWINRYELPCFEVCYRAKDGNVYLELLQYSILTGVKSLERRFMAGR